MKLTTAQLGEIAIVRVAEARVMYPMLGTFSTAVTTLLQSGQRRIVIDLSLVTYVDSSTIGCLMDLSRQTDAVRGELKLSGVQKRVETMLTLTGAQHFIPIHRDEQSAIESFGA